MTKVNVGYLLSVEYQGRMTVSSPGNCFRLSVSLFIKDLFNRNK